MDAPYFLRGLVIGLSVAAPVGPIGVLCIRRSLAEGRGMGFAAGLGAATADAVYGGIAAFGLTSISGFLVEQQFALRLLGGSFLCYLGLRTFRSVPATQAAVAGGKSLFAAYLSTLFLTLSNPATILSFVGIFAAAGLGAGADYGGAGRLTLGVFFGSALWWLLLSQGVALFRDRMDATWQQRINRLSGVTLLVFGLAVLWPLLFPSR